MAARKESEAASTLRELFYRLVTYKVRAFGATSSDQRNMPDEMERAEVGDSNIVSSLWNQGYDPNDLSKRYKTTHALVIDIDHPSWLVASSTPGHFHLYVDVPGGIPWAQYHKLLTALADAGVVEQGYAGASIRRGHSDVRLPWVKKEAATSTPPLAAHTHTPVYDD